MATGYPVVVPIPFNPKEDDVKTAFFTQWLAYFGAPNCIIADNYEAFGLLFDVLNDQFGTIVQPSATNHSRSHAQIKRLHRTIRARIISVCASQGIPWTEGLMPVLASIRFTVNHNNVSPYEQVFGFPAPSAMHKVPASKTGRWSTQLLKHAKQPCAQAHTSSSHHL